MSEYETKGREIAASQGRVLEKHFAGFGRDQPIYFWQRPAIDWEAHAKAGTRPTFDEVAHPVYHTEVEAYEALAKGNP